MSKAGNGKRAEGGTLMDSAVPYATVNRRERSRKLAQTRRDKYKSIMDDLIGVLPFPNESIAQLDYNSRLRLALCFLRIKTVINTKEKFPTGTTQGYGRRAAATYSKQIVKRKPQQFTKPVLVYPGMLHDLMSEALDGFMMVLQLDGTVVFLSEGVHKYLGLFQSEYIGMGVYELILEEDHDEVRRKISEAEAKSLTRTTKLGATDLSFFCRMKCSRGKVTNTITRSPGYKLVYVRGTLKVAKDEPFIACVVHPVSPPSILELRMEGNMFVTHYSMDMTCLFFDGRLRQLLGYAKQDLVGRTPFNLHHHEDTEATLQCSRGVMSRGEGLSGYYRFLNHFGEYVWLQTRATLMYDSRTGLPSYIVCMNFIISKEDGKKDLEIRQAITSGDSNINSDADHAHDPFPLAVREDDKVVNPFVFDEDQESSPATLKEEEPSSTVEVLGSTSTSSERKSSTDSCASASSNEISGSGSIPSIESSSIPPNSIPPLGSNSIPSRGSNSIPPLGTGSVTVESSSSSRHSMTNSITSRSSVSSSVSSSVFQPSPNRADTNHASLQSAAHFGNDVLTCQPDSTTANVSRSRGTASDSTQKKQRANSNLTTHSDAASYQGESSSSCRPAAGSVGNESEISGSSRVRRSSPESTLCVAFSPDYPPSVFSCDGSIPPPSVSHVSHIDSPVSDSSSSTCHRSSSQMPRVFTPVTPEAANFYPVQSVDPHHHFQPVPSQQYLHGQPNHTHYFSVPGVPADSRVRSDLPQLANSTHASYGSPRIPQQSFMTVVNGNGSHGDMGSTPTNLLPDWNSKKVAQPAFTRVSDFSTAVPSPYAFFEGTATSHRYAAATPNQPHTYAGHNVKQNGLSGNSRTQATLGSHQHQQVLNQASLFPVGASVQYRSSSQAGDFSRCQVTIQSTTADLPKLTVEDLKVLDAFTDQDRGEEQLGLFQARPTHTMNWNGATAI